MDSVLLFTSVSPDWLRHAVCLTRAVNASLTALRLASQVKVNPESCCDKGTARNMLHVYRQSLEHIFLNGTARSVGMGHEVDWLLTSQGENLSLALSTLAYR